MSVGIEIERLNASKSAIAQAIRDKGVDVPDDAKIDTFADYVALIGGSQGIPVTFTGSNIITATDTIANQPFVGLKIFGKSTQDSTQLLPLTDEHYSANGMTGEMQPDGSIIVNGNPSTIPSNLIYIPLKLSPGNYYISGGQDAPGCVIAFIETKSNSGTGYWANQSFAIDGTETSIVLMVQSKYTDAITDYRIEAMLNKGTKQLPIQKYNAVPSNENPIPIINAGASGSITLNITDGADKNRKLFLNVQNGLLGVPVESGGNCEDANGKLYKSNYWDFGDGQQHILCDEIESYNSEEITTPYISSTGTLTTGAQVLYVLPEPRTEPIPSDIMSAYRSLTTYEAKTVISTIEDVAAMEAIVYCNAEKTIDRKVREGIAAAVKLSGGNL